MYTGELRARIMVYTDNLDPSDGDYRPRARRIVADIQEKYDEVWNHRLWRWSLGSSVLAVPQGSKTATLPLDFGHIHKEGGVFLDGKRLRDLSSALMDEIHQGIYTPTSDLGYTISGFSDADQRGTVVFDTEGVSAPVIKYKKRPPLLADRPWPGYPSLVEGAAVGLTGTFQYRATYTTPDGFEHEYGDTTQITVADKKITVTAPDPGPIGEHHVSAVNIYRTTNGGAIFYRLYVITLGNLETFVRTDSTSDAALVAGAVLVQQSTLSRIPAQYHHTVLIPAVRSMRKQSQGDTRDFEKEYQRGLAAMVVEQRPYQSEVQQLPRWSPVQMY